MHFCVLYMMWGYHCVTNNILYTCIHGVLSLQHEYPDIVNWYRDLSEDFPDIVTFVPSIGKSVEGRDMPAVHITAGTSADTMKIYFQCQIHAS